MCRFALAQTFRSINVYWGEENTGTEPAMDTQKVGKRKELSGCLRMAKLMDTPMQMDGLNKLHT